MNDMREQLAEIAKTIEPEVAEEEVLEGEPEIEASQEAETEEEAEEIRTIADLASAIEWEASNIYGLEIPMGEGREPVQLGALKDMYQDLERGKEAIKKEREIFERERHQALSQVGQMQQPQTEDLVNAQARIIAIQQQFESVDWASLEAEDASQALLLKSKLGDLMTAAKSEYQQEANKANAAMQQQTQAYLSENLRKVQGKIPDWVDPGKRAQEWQEIASMSMSEYEFTQQEVSSMADYRVVKALYDLYQYKVRDKEVEKASKKVKSAPPRVLKPGVGNKKDAQYLKDKLKSAKQTKNPRNKARILAEALNIQ